MLQKLISNYPTSHISTYRHVCQLNDGCIPGQSICGRWHSRFPHVGFGCQRSLGSNIPMASRLFRIWSLANWSNELPVTSMNCLYIKKWPPRVSFSIYYNPLKRSHASIYSPNPPHPPQFFQKHKHCKFPPAHILSHKHSKNVDL